MAPDQWLKIGAVCVLVLGVVAVLVTMTRDTNTDPRDSDFDPSAEAVAEIATESDVTVPEEVPPGVYPPAPSKAVGMTPEWRSFADSVDRICGLTYNYMQADQARMLRQARAQGWSVPRTEAADLRILAEQGSRIVRATAVIGKPPAEAGLFKRWRANVALRRDLKFQASAAAARGDGEQAGQIMARVGGLKERSDELGQRFGLRICTSN